MAEYVRRLISDKVMDVQKYYPVTTITGSRQSEKKLRLRLPSDPSVRFRSF